MHTTLMILFLQCEMEVIKVEPDIHREAVLLASHSTDSQYHITEEDESDPFTFISVKPEDKVGKTVPVPRKNHQLYDVDQ